jgi:hypothetical protein
MQEKIWRRRQEEAEAEAGLQEASKQLAETEQTNVLQQELEENRKAALQAQVSEAERQAEFLGALFGQGGDEYLGPVEEIKEQGPVKVWFRSEKGDFLPVDKVSPTAQKLIADFGSEEEFDKEVEVSPRVAVGVMRKEGFSSGQIGGFLRPFDEKSKIVDIKKSAEVEPKLNDWVVAREQKKFTVPVGSYEYGVGVSTKGVLPTSMRFVKVPRLLV